MIFVLEIILLVAILVMVNRLLRRNRKMSEKISRLKKRMADDLMKTEKEIYARRNSPDEWRD
tara:strand:+ start:890 stop:1075 length:186 start_codon:yes stop_codon:yes gene_type:complete